MAQDCRTRRVADGMVVLTYSGRSRPSALEIMEASAGGIYARRSDVGDVNWGREYADTALNGYIGNATNKRVMRELFRAHGVPMPELYSLEDAAQRAILGQQMIGRPDSHTRGRGFWLVDSADSFIRALKGTRRKRAATHFMERINPAHEYRVHVFRGRSIRLSEKAFDRPRDGATYTMIKATGDPGPSRTAALKAVRALELDFGAVDVLALEDGTPYVLEVNTAPGLGGSMPRVWAETFLRWYEECDEDEEDEW